VEPEDVTRRSLAWSAGGASAVAARGSQDDPRCAGAGGSGGGGSLRFFSDRSSGSVQDTGEIPLPCERWVALGSDAQPKGYAYVDRGQEAGPCKRVVVHDGRRAKASCSARRHAIAYDLVAGTDEGVVRTALRLGAGTLRYCTEFDAASGRDGSDGRRYRAFDAPAPALCVAPPPPCGDGIVDPGQECDDGNTATGDGCSPICTFEPLCLVTNNPGSPASASIVRIAPDGTLTSAVTTPLPGNNTAGGHFTAARSGRRVYLLLSVPGQSAIAGFDVALDGTVSALPTLTGLFRPLGIVCPASQDLLFTLEDFGLSGGRVGSFTIGAGGALSAAQVLSPVGGAFIRDMFADFHPVTQELWVEATYLPPVVPIDGVTLARIAYDAAGNMGLAQSQSLSPSPFGAVRARDLRFTADVGFLAVPGYFDGSSDCFAHWTSPGATIPPLAGLQTSCGTPFPSDAQGFVPRPEGGALFYYQSGTALDAAEFTGATIVSHSSIVPVHATNQLLLAFGGRVLVSLGPAAGEVVTYAIAPDLVTLTPKDAVPLGAAPHAGVLLPCPGP
jgi:cysteine-rich repeat protein